LSRTGQGRTSLPVWAWPFASSRLTPAPATTSLFLKGKPAGIIEAKREGEVLTSFEAQTGDYATKLPSWLHPPVRPCGLATAHDRIARSPSPREATYLVTE
jgi:hypothetical protein